VWAQPRRSVGCWSHAGWVRAGPCQATLRAAVLSLELVPGTADAITAVAEALLTLDVGLV